MNSDLESILFHGNTSSPESHPIESYRFMIMCMCNKPACVHCGTISTIEITPEYLVVEIEEALIVAAEFHQKKKET